MNIYLNKYGVLRKIFTILLIFLSTLIFSQQIDVEEIDRLKNQLNKNELSNNEKIIIFNKLALFYFGKNNKKYIYYNNQIYEIAKKINSNYGFGLYFLNTAHLNIVLSDYSKARMFARKAQVLLLKEKRYSDYLLSIQIDCFVYDFYGQHKLGEDLALKTINKYSNIKNIEEIYYYLAGLYSDLGKTKNAFINLNKALDIFEKAKDKNGICKCYYQMSLISYANKDVDKAILYLNKSNKINNEFLFNKNHKVLYNHALSIYYLAKENFSEALKHSNIVFKSKKNDNLYLCNSHYYLIQADIYKNLKNYKKATSYLKSVDLKCGDNFDLYYYNQIKGDIYFELGDYKKALIFYKKNQISPNYNHDIYEYLSKTEIKLGNYKKAYDYLTIYNKESIKYLKDKQIKELNELEILFNLKSKDLEINEILIKKETNEKKLLNKQYYFNIIIFILIITLLISVFLYINFRIKKKNIKILNSNNEKLSELNRISQKNLKEKEILLKEVHHRVKNNLQLIISLLNIQVLNDKNTSVDVFLEKSQSRIQSISLIHENLYQSDLIDNINFKSYLENLIQSILDIHVDNLEDIEININDFDVEFNIETAIPLGLIINEILINAFKHAFVKDQSQSKVIQISIVKLNDYDFELKIFDNGIGFDGSNISKTSVGLELVSLLILQLKGKINRINDGGTLYIIQFQKIS